LDARSSTQEWSKDIKDVEMEASYKYLDSSPQALHPKTNSGESLPSPSWNPEQSKNAQGNTNQELSSGRYHFN